VFVYVIHNCNKPSEWMHFIKMDLMYHIINVNLNIKMILMC
jgi:hypothetical protein